MKELIDIPEESYNFAKECKSKGSSKYDWGLTYNNTVFMIANGTPIPDNATNGDFIKVMFPKAWKSNYIDSDNKCTLYIDDDYELEVDIDWWNAPYKRGNEND